MLLDWWPLGRLSTTRPDRSLLKLGMEKAPFLALAVADGLITFWAQRQAGAVKDLAELPLMERAANAFISYWRYVEKLVWPVDLSVFYPFATGWPVWQVVVAVLLLAGCSWLAASSRRRYPWVFFGWFWFLLTITPVIGFLQTGIQAMADRYSYIPSIGLFVMISWTAGELAVRKGWRDLLAGVMIILLMGLMVATRGQVRHWRRAKLFFGMPWRLPETMRWRIIAWAAR